MRYSPALLAVARAINTERVVVVAIAAMMDEHKEPLEIASLLEIDPDVASLVVDEIRAAQPKKRKETSAEKTARKTQLPVGWKLPPDDVEYARKLGLTDMEIRQIAIDFRDYWRSTGKVMLDWSLTWQTWVRRDAKKRGKVLPDDPTLFAAATTDTRGSEMWRSTMKAWKESRTWVYSLGPEPGQPGCRVPADILNEFRG